MRQANPEDRAELVGTCLREPRGEEATNARNVVALDMADKFGDAQAPSLGSNEPQQLPTDPATTKRRTNVDRDPSPFTVDFDIHETDGLVAQQADPSVAGRALLNDQPPLQVGSVEVGVQASLPFLVLGEPACDERREIPRQRR